MKFVGVPAFQELARRVGISTLDRWDAQWLSLTLGGGEVRLLELTGAYATLARGGNYVPVEAFVDVRTSRNETFYETRDGLNGEQVIDPRLVYELLHVTGDLGSRLLKFGANTPLNLGRPHMVKTGTTDDYLRAGRAIMLTFRPTRTWADTRTEAELSQALREIGKQYKDIMSQVQDWLPELRR